MNFTYLGENSSKFFLRIFPKLDFSIVVFAIKSILSTSLPSTLIINSPPTILP